MLASERATLKQRPSKGQNADFAYRVLKQEIITLRLAPGSDFDEAEIAKRLNISRTPLREAVVRLSGEGLLRLHPNRGARITPMEWDDIRDHLEAFEFLQRLTHRWAAVRRSSNDMEEILRHRDDFESAFSTRDMERMIEVNFNFHAAIARSSKNLRLEKSYLLQLTESYRISRMAMIIDYYPDENSHKIHTNKIREEHNELTNSILDQDADRADYWAKKHSDLARKRITEVLRSSIDSGMDMTPTGIFEGR